MADSGAQPAIDSESMLQANFAPQESPEIRQRSPHIPAKSPDRRWSPAVGMRSPQIPVSTPPLLQRIPHVNAKGHGKRSRDQLEFDYGQRNVDHNKLVQDMDFLASIIGPAPGLEANAEVPEPGSSAAAPFASLNDGEADTEIEARIKRFSNRFAKKRSEKAEPDSNATATYGFLNEEEADIDAETRTNRFSRRRGEKPEPGLTAASPFASLQELEASVAAGVSTNGLAPLLAAPNANETLGVEEPCENSELGEALGAENPAENLDPEEDVDEALGAVDPGTNLVLAEFAEEALGEEHPGASLDYEEDEPQAEPLPACNKKHPTGVATKPSQDAGAAQKQRTRRKTTTHKLRPNFKASQVDDDDWVVELPSRWAWLTDFPGTCKRHLQSFTGDPGRQEQKHRAAKPLLGGPKRRACNSWPFGWCPTLVFALLLVGALFLRFVEPVPEQSSARGQTAPTTKSVHQPPPSEVDRNPVKRNAVSPDGTQAQFEEKLQAFYHSSKVQLKKLARTLKDLTPDGFDNFRQLKAARQEAAEMYKGLRNGTIVWNQECVNRFMRWWQLEAASEQHVLEDLYTSRVVIGFMKERNIPPTRLAEWVVHVGTNILEEEENDKGTVSYRDFQEWLDNTPSFDAIYKVERPKYPDAQVIFEEVNCQRVLRKRAGAVKEEPCEPSDNTSLMTWAIVIEDAGNTSDGNPSDSITSESSTSDDDDDI
eukprot:TRINITY_DN21110_c2_g1_i3.p1 TRINITY_DN21110_c2_g1~~TRINITY_DN21110_c2_g1_i3.p1  ORF type:complete len:711 (+),score=130.93 TRINITY_DN21110_c2_g1_i3:44-2176(+)